MRFPDVGDAQKDVDSREQSEARFLTALSRRIFPCSPHMTTLDLGSAGFHWDSALGLNGPVLLDLIVEVTLQFDVT